jgi:hypothetical protein
MSSMDFYINTDQAQLKVARSSYMQNTSVPVHIFILFLIHIRTANKKCLEWRLEVLIAFSTRRKSIEPATV